MDTSLKNQHKGPAIRNTISSYRSFIQNQHKQVTDTMTEITGPIAFLHNHDTLDELILKQHATILVARTDFGYTDDIPTLVQNLQKAGISCVIAKRVSRAFFRHAVNNGLAVIETELPDTVTDNGTVTVRLDTGRMTLDSKEIAFPPYPEYVRHIINAGSILDAVKKELGRSGT